MKVIAERVKALAPISGFPPIVVGDFNATPDSDEIRYMKGLCSLGGPSAYFADTFGMVGAGPGITFTGQIPLPAICESLDRRIDYVFVRGPDARGRGEPLSAQVCFNRAVGGVLPRDHYGVSATLRAEV